MHLQQYLVVLLGSWFLHVHFHQRIGKRVLGILFYYNNIVSLPYVVPVCGKLTLISTPKTCLCPGDVVIYECSVMGIPGGFMTFLVGSFSIVMSVESSCPGPDCPAIHYNILASNCGSCPTTTNLTTVTCTNAPNHERSTVYVYYTDSCLWKDS